MALAAALAADGPTRAPAESAVIGPAARTLVQLQVPIAEFAQDGGRLVWMTGRCRDPGADARHRGNDAVAVHTLRSRRTVTLTRRACRPNQPDRSDRRGGWSGLVVAGTRVVYWHPVYYGGTGAVAIETRTAAIDDRLVAPLSSVHLNVHSDGGGALAVGADGDGPTLAVGVSDVEGRGHECYCTWRVVGGAVYVVSRRRATRLPGAPEPSFVDVAAGRIALIPAAREFTQHDPGALPPAQRPAVVELRNATSGALLRRLPVPGVVLGLAVSRETVAVLVAREQRTEMLQYDVRTGAQRAGARVPSGTALVDVDGRTVVYRSARDVFVVGPGQALRVRAAATPIGLSIEGRRVAWAENVGGRGRIRAFTVR
jgi:hypothetical protein